MTGSRPLPGLSDGDRRKFVVPAAPAHRLPREGETIYARGATKPDYEIDANGCWVWQKFLNKGYPHGKPKPHRLYYERAKGPIPAGHDVHHVCRNRACVNPAHLDTVPHGEHQRRHLNAVSPFTEDDVRYIKLSPLMMRELAAMFGVSMGAINDILSGRNWPHVVVEPPPRRPCRECGGDMTEKNRHAVFCTARCRGNFNSRLQRQRKRAA